MDVKVINKQITFNLKHFLIKFKSQTYMYQVDAHPQPPQAGLLLSQIHFDKTWRRTVAYFGYEI